MRSFLVRTSSPLHWAGKKQRVPTSQGSSKKFVKKKKKSAPASGEQLLLQTFTTTHVEVHCTRLEACFPRRSSPSTSYPDEPIYTKRFDLQHRGKLNNSLQSQSTSQATRHGRTTHQKQNNPPKTKQWRGGGM